VTVAKTGVWEMIKEAEKCAEQRISANEFPSVKRVALGITPDDVALAVERDGEFVFILKTGLRLAIRKKGDRLYDAELELPGSVDVNIMGAEVDLCGR